MKTYSGPSYGSIPISLSVIQSRIREASLTPLIRLEDAIKKSSYQNPTYENKFPIQSPEAVRDYGKAMSIGGPDYPQIIEQRAKGFQEVPGEQVSARRYSMTIPLAEEKRTITLISPRTIDDKVRDDTLPGKEKMYQGYVFAYDGKLYVMPRQVRMEASEYFERMKDASSRIRPDLSEKMKKETYDVFVQDLGDEFKMTHFGNLTGIRYSVLMPKISYKNEKKKYKFFHLPQTQLDKAA